MLVSVSVIILNTVPNTCSGLTWSLKLSVISGSFMFIGLPSFNNMLEYSDPNEGYDLIYTP